jgi:putative transposase
MPRETRQFEIGGIYHCINRGVDKRKIFLKSQDYSRFILGLELFNQKKNIDLWGYVAREGIKSIAYRINAERKIKGEPIVELLAFALMPNHFHFVIREITKDGISNFMQKMGGYSSYFNKQNKRTGSLFQSRYKSIPVFDSQIEIIFNYVHANPVGLKEKGWKDGKIQNYKKSITWLKDYKWSSYRDYTGIPTFSCVTNREFFLKVFKGKRGCRRSVERWIKEKGQHIDSWE